jgi:hypothetical protein
MANNVLLGWTKEPIIQPILATGGEEDKTPPNLPFKGRDSVEFFVDMEAVAFGNALFVGNTLACALGDSLHVRNDTLGVASRFAAIVVRTQ